MSCGFTLSDFDFALPPELIAQHPAAERSASRLLDGRGVEPVDRVFRELPGLLQAGDLLVFNDSRVIPARFTLQKPTGGKVEGLFVSRQAEGSWIVMLKNLGPVRPEVELRFADAPQLAARAISKSAWASPT